MTKEQREALQWVCLGYRVEFDEAHYRVYPADSWMMPGWAEGWIGGEPGTIYVGCSPTGEVNS